MNNDDTTNDMEGLLRQLKPRGAPPELRPRILAAIDVNLSPLPLGEGQGVKADRWLRWSALATAASLLVGVMLNVWASKASEHRLAQLVGPPPISKRAAEVAKAVAEVTDAATGQWVYERLTAAASRPSPEAVAKYYAAVEQLVRELQTVSKDQHDETRQEDSQMDRRHPRRAGGDTTGGQRLVRLDHRYTA